MLLPLVFPAVGLVVVALASAIANPKIAAQTRTRAVHATAVFLATFQMPMAFFALEPFDCRRVPDGQWYFDTDPTLDCDSSSLNPARSVGVIAVTFWVAVIPIAYSVVVYAVHDKPFSKGSLSMFGLLYQRFETRYLYWGLVETLQRLALVFVIRFLSHRTVVAAGVAFLLMLASAALHNYFHPYRLVAHDWQVCESGS
jgi:hypothetical protein